MKYKYFVLLYIALTIMLCESNSSVDARPNESCSAAKREEQLCGSYAFKIVKPLLDHIRKIQNKMDIKDVQIESKDQEIGELREKVAELQQKVSDNLKSDKSFELYEELVETKTAFIENLKSQVDNLKASLGQVTNLCQSSKNESDQISEFYRTIAANSQTINELNKQILEFKSDKDADSVKIQKCESKLKEKDELVAQRELDQVAEYNSTISAHLETIERQSKEILENKAKIDSDNVQMQECKNHLKNRNNLIMEKNKQIDILRTLEQNTARQLNETKVKLEKFTKTSLEVEFDSCIPFGTCLGIHKIKVPGLDPFDVLCASAATGPGWIVIQQRINGKVDFYRDFATYKTGFGSLNADFFLGLEKIHRLTSNQRHELYIHLEEFNGRITYAAYENFAISGENDQYRLISVDGFSGNSTEGDNMKGHKGKKFYTFDRETQHSCAKNYHGGWWYSGCGWSNLNGLYYGNEVNKFNSNHWYSRKSLKKVQMLIRPKMV